MAPAKEKASKKSKKVQQEEEEEDDTIEGPWRFMGGLDPEDPRMMRRVMAKIYTAYNPSAAHLAGKKYNIKCLTKAQRARVNAMLKEAADDNPLLVSILTWFGKKHNTAKDEIVLAAAAFIRAKVKEDIRQPRQYRLAYAGAVDMWKAFLLDNDNAMGGGLSDVDFEAMLKTVDHAHIIKRVMAQRQLEDQGIVVPEVSFATPKDDEDTEPEEDGEDEMPESPAKKGKKAKDVFTETGHAGFKQTRSGRNFRTRSDYLYDDDEELERIMEESRLEAEAEKARSREQEVADKAKRRAKATEEEELGALRKAGRELGVVSLDAPTRSKSQKKKAREELAELAEKKKQSRETEDEAANLGDVLGGLSVKKG